MVLNEVCPPALIYLIFSVTQVTIDTFKGQYNTAFVKIWVALVFTIVLNYLCRRGLGIISWFIVFIPFMLMTLIIGILLYVFGLDPATGRIQMYAPPREFKQDIADYRAMAREAGEVPGVPQEPSIPTVPRVYDDYYNQREGGRTANYARGSDSERDRNNDGYARGGMVPGVPQAPAVPAVPAVPATPATPAVNNIGGQTDSHGCLSGAGYAWCSALGKCVGPGHPCLSDTALKSSGKEGFAWPTLKLPEWNISTPLIKLPSMSLAFDSGSMQLPMNTATSMGCVGAC